MMNSNRKITHTYTTDKPPSLRVIEAVAEVEGVEQTDLPPLFEVIDPDALDKAIEGDTTVSFGYAGYRVRILCTGESSVKLEIRTAPN